MRKLLTILFLGISLCSNAQQSKGVLQITNVGEENPLSKLSENEKIAYDFFREEILYKEFKRLKYVVVYAQIASEKNYEYNICNPINGSELILSAPYDFTSLSSKVSSPSKTGYVYIKEQSKDANNSYVVVYLKNNKAKYFYSIAVDLQKKKVTNHCNISVGSPKLVLDSNYENNVKAERISYRSAGLYNGLKDKEPAKSGIPQMTPKKIKGKVFYKCNNCKGLFGEDYKGTTGLSDGQNFYYRDLPLNALLKKYYSKVDFIGDYMYFLVVSESTGAFQNRGTTRHVNENIA